ncbi:uncharacterized protein, partial [Littorina saxatilis]|uniref:uncharacterized protein n=1 Tax=Littorina saxatilis TaxID=31220 RepID=UPI0038B527F9
MYVEIKRSKARERYGAGYAVTSSIVAVVVFSAVTSVIHAVTDADVGRTFILNPEYLSWEAAKQKCQDLNGVLAKVDAFHVVPELGYDEEWTVWVGLKVISMNNLTWEDGSEVNWTNWYIVDWDNENPACVTIMTTPPYSWVMRSCNKTLPSLCEIPGGACNFTKTEHASLKAFNDRHVYEDAASCLKMCEETRELDCRSLEVQRANAKTCQLSIESRWTQPQDFITGDRYWDYYHWTCINGTYLGGVYVSPNGAYLPSTEAATVTPTEPTTVPPTEPTTTTDPDVVCVKIKPIPENETEEVHEEVKELRTLAAAFTEQKKMKKRISTTDPRPSATYVGSVAVGLVLGVLGLVVCLDLLSLPRHVSEMARRGACCGQCTKRFKKKRKDKDMRFTEFGGRPTRRLGPLMIGARMPRNFKPKRLPKDKRVESTYNSTASGEDKSQKLGLHLERIRRLEQGLGVRTGPSRSGSALSLDEEQEDEIVRVEQSDDPDVSVTAVGPTTMYNAEDEDVDADDLESFKRTQPQVTMLRPGFFVPEEDVCIERRVERFRSRPPPVLMNNQEDEGEEEEEEEQEEGEDEEEEEE